MSRTLVFLILGGLSILVGCRVAPSEIPRTELTAYLAANGAGDVRSFSVDSIQGWFNAHGPVALAVKKKCAAIVADASFGDTVDGRICKAAYATVVYQPRTSDEKSFGAGWK